MKIQIDKQKHKLMNRWIKIIKVYINSSKNHKAHIKLKVLKMNKEQHYKLQKTLNLKCELKDFWHLQFQH